MSTSISVGRGQNQETDVQSSQFTPSTAEAVETASGTDAVPFNNKYVYPEFAGWAGERLLDSILRKILPIALHRTWEILTDRQAQGNDCFLSIASLAEVAERVERTIRLNIHELEARKLLSLHPAQKILRQTDGSLKLKLVVVKDFSGLYALALEYLRWRESDCYIPPEREFAEVIRSNETLKRKLIRFNNYRRIIENKVPGPKPMEREEHRWYTEYDSAQDSQALGSPGGPTSPQQAEDAGGQSSATNRNHYLQENLQEDLKKVSQERIITSNQNNELNGDSFDSELPQGRGGASGYTKNPTEQQPETGIRSDSHHELTKTNLTNPSSPSFEKDRAAGAEQPARRERADLDARAQAFVQRAMAAYEATRGEIGRRGQPNAPKVKPNALVSSFVREVSPVFRDQNVKGSLTRALRAVEHTTLSQKDILACLVKAYVVTLETKQVRLQYRRPDGDIKMPLFCTMFARFISDCASGKFGYTDEHLARDIAADDRLVLFLVEHDLEKLLQGETVEADGEQETTEQVEMPAEEDAQPPDNVIPLYPEAPEDDLQAEEPQEESQQPWINVNDLQAGWSSWGGADYWANRLREHYPYGTNDYGYDVQPAVYEGQPTGRWLFIFYARRDPQHCWAIYGNTEEVKLHLESPETIWVAYDGVVGSTGPAD